MAILNYTTKIPPEQTIGEIQKMLTRFGVAAMMTEYDGPHVAAVSFRMVTNGQPMSFRLPCNWKAVIEIFKKQRIRARITPEVEQQAIRTAWRIIKDWVEAQLALVEVNMVTVPQVFLPYAIMKDDRTLSEHIAEDPKFLLGDGS
jgi:hypothetical protein